MKKTDIKNFKITEIENGYLLCDFSNNKTYCFDNYEKVIEHLQYLNKKEYENKLPKEEKVIDNFIVFDEPIKCKYKEDPDYNYGFANASLLIKSKKYFLVRWRGMNISDLVLCYSDNLTLI